MPETTASPESCEGCAFRRGPVFPWCGCEDSEFFKGPIVLDGWCVAFKLAEVESTNGNPQTTPQWTPETTNAADNLVWIVARQWTGTPPQIELLGAYRSEADARYAATRLTSSMGAYVISLHTVRLHD